MPTTKESGHRSEVPEELTCHCMSERVGKTKQIPFLIQNRS